MWKSRRFRSLYAGLFLALCALPAFAQDAPPKLDVPYVPTPQNVVDEMIKLGGVKKGDVVYDLGCGDGRIVITAAKQFDTRGIGVDIDPQRIKESNENAAKAGVADRVRFAVKDLFQTDFRDATVVMMYLLPEINVKLRPILFEQLKPGTRIVSHSFDMGDWKPDKTASVEYRRLLYWVIPASVGGTWEATLPDGQTARVTMQQRFQEASGKAVIGGSETAIRDAKLVGDQLSFTVDGTRYTGRVNGDTITGTTEGGTGGGKTWSAKRSGPAVPIESRAGSPAAQNRP